MASGCSDARRPGEGQTPSASPLRPGISRVPSVSISRGCCNNGPQTGAQTTDICRLAAGGQRCQSGCQQGHTPVSASPVLWRSPRVCLSPPRRGVASPSPQHVCSDPACRPGHPRGLGLHSAHSAGVSVCAALCVGRVGSVGSSRLPPACQPPSQRNSVFLPRFSLGTQASAVPQGVRQTRWFCPASALEPRVRLSRGLREVTGQSWTWAPGFLSAGSPPEGGGPSHGVVMVAPAPLTDCPGGWLSGWLAAG